jgi:Protein of unknown function (DUF3995)
MTKRPDGIATAVSNRLPRWSRGMAYAACGWAFVFAALSCYWALGGTAGAQTISPAIAALARAHDPLVYAALWLGALVKVISGVVVLALIQPWGKRVPRPALLLLAWGAGTLLFVHGGLFFVVGVLALSGTIRVGTPLLMLRWYTFLWGPWWLLGGILFLLVAWIGLRRSSNGRAGLAFSALGVGAALVLLVLSGGTIG